MYEEVEVDSNLMYLKDVILSLDMFSFDKDILDLLMKLNDMVDKKLYSSLKCDKDIVDVKYKAIFYFDNK